MNWDLILDGVMIVLLLATVIYAFLLNRRLAVLRSDKDALESFIERFTEATAKADSSIRGMRNTAEQCRSMLGDPLSKAEALRDELLFLIDRADKSAERLAGSQSSGSDTSVAGGAAQRHAPAAAGDQAPQERPAARRQRPPAAGSGAGPVPNSGPGRDMKGQKGTAGDAAADDEVRSQAERELLDALRKAR